jgi:hypothetical protein
VLVDVKDPTGQWRRPLVGRLGPSLVADLGSGTSSGRSRAEAPPMRAARPPFVPDAARKEQARALIAGS